MSIILKAAALAVRAHEGQKRKYTGFPYITHPARVAGRVGILPVVTEEMVAAAYLHDVLEDTTITKAEIEFIRGVSADYSIQKLLEKELIVIAGRNEDMVGKPLVYNTSKNFMDYLGINNAGELPQLKDITNIDIVLPTSGLEAAPEGENGSLAVAEDGTLQPLSE